MKLSFRNSFIKDFDRASKEIQKAWIESLTTLTQSSNSRKLRRHTLKGKYQGLESIDVKNCRALFTQKGEHFMFYHLRDKHDLYISKIALSGATSQSQHDSRLKAHPAPSSL